MYKYLFFTYAFAHGLILLGILYLGWRTPSKIWASLFFVSAALVYDNAVIALGSALGEGEILRTLNWPRFALHAVSSLPVMLAAWEIGKIAGLRWRRLAWPAYLSCIIVALCSGISQFPPQIQPACLSGLIYYASSTPSPLYCFPGQSSLPTHGNPLSSIMMIIACFIIGVRLWREYSWPWLTVATSVMFITASVSISYKIYIGPIASNLGEIIFLAGLGWSMYHFTFRQPHLLSRKDADLEWRFFDER